MKQRNWRADVSKAEADFGFTAPTSLKEGLEKSVKWYRENGWLK
jgi:nucleoside-diphosphate-sugar epimerase